MRLKKHWAFALSMLASVQMLACIHSHVLTQPITVAFTVTPGAATCQLAPVHAAAVTGTSDPVDPSGQHKLFTVDRLFIGSAYTVTCSADGYVSFSQQLTPFPSASAELPLRVTLQPAFPPVPSREQVLGVHMTFQGLVVNTKQFGPLPWFCAALPWLSAADRQAVYDATHAAGDTHTCMVIPSGPPLYDEPGQPYDAGHFPALDWTNGDTQMVPAFRALVKEVASNHLVLNIHMDERFEHSIKEIPIVLKALLPQPDDPLDLTQYAVEITGFDGVFYGWDPTQVVAWGKAARAIAPNAYLGIEHNPGHIPLGEGGGDFLPGGRMQDFDLVLSEFADQGRPDLGDDTVWQIIARLSRGYVRAPDQPAGDDPHPPFYLVDSPRGPRYYCAFEFNTRWGAYAWVRVNINNFQPLQAAIAQRRQYIRALGVKYTG